MKIILLLSLVVCCSQLHAEVYRWTDSNGKVHYGDQKPKTNAEDVTAKVKTTNVDTSTNEHQKMESIFRKENDADRDYQAQQSRPPAEQQARCASARNYLSKVSGRVVFVDQNGKDQHVSEQERKQREQEARDYIQENCSN